MLATLIANANRDPKRRPRPFKLEDFMPKTGNVTQTPQQQAAMLKLAASSLAARANRGR